MGTGYGAGFRSISQQYTNQPHFLCWGGFYGQVPSKFGAIHRGVVFPVADAIRGRTDPPSE